MEIGVFTFADVSPHPGGVDAAQRLPELVEEMELADQVGLDVFGIGEHHRPDFAAPSPPILLAAGASRTSTRGARCLPDHVTGRPLRRASRSSIFSSNSSS